MHATLLEVLAGALDEFREEYKEVPPADTDMNFLLISWFVGKSYLK